MQHTVALLHAVLESLPEFTHALWLILIPPPSKKTQAICLRVCCPSVYFAYVFTQWRDFNETGHRHSSCEWELLKKFSRSEFKGKGHSGVKCAFPADRWPSVRCRLTEAYIPITLWRRGLFVSTRFYTVYNTHIPADITESTKLLLFICSCQCSK